MLISFSIQNWMSFKDRVTISNIASKQITHRERVPKIGKYKISIAPVAALYGGNASGKSNICAALRFARGMIVKGTKTRDDKIGIQPFLLSSEYRNGPSRFWFEILADESIYEFYFSATKDRICEEKLTKVGHTRDQVLYERENESITINDKDKDKKSHLGFIWKSTRSNQLFLTNTVENNNETYRDVYDWFSFVLKVITPEAKYTQPEYLIDEEHLLYDKANLILRQLDTGISRLGAEVDKEIDLDKVEEGKGVYLNLLETLTSERYIKSSQNGKGVVKKLISYHLCEDGTETQFNLNQESDGTKRLIELLPAFIQEEPGVYGVFVIDEIDRSLHHLLLRRLLEKYLNSCNTDTRAQIIFTTHDLLLMDQELLRRDEMFVVERDVSGVSSVIPLNEYKGIRQDKDILKSYLQGRFGGIPSI